MTWIVLGLLVVAILVLFVHPQFMPNLRDGMDREDIAREVENMKNLKAELDAKKGLDGDQYLWRHMPGSP